MSRYGIIFNVDRCIGCEACFVACKEENKVVPGIRGTRSAARECRKARHQLLSRLVPALRGSRMHEGLPRKGDLQGAAR